MIFYLKAQGSKKRIPSSGGARGGFRQRAQGTGHRAQSTGHGAQTARLQDRKTARPQDTSLKINKRTRR